MSALPWDKEEEVKFLGKHLSFASEEDLTAFKETLQNTIPDTVPTGWSLDILIQLEVRKDVSAP